ncbi:rhodanese-like domain-containing protein [Tepidiforma flava]|uniref:Rhodanese-like domain-containing protein n=1 Tax=Tepidiforma flava TaxID=3004094 RepID=A0ABY7M7F5_9CHLR|nr:rhodanese-like domain-containing protein [Tepidiforma flava]WBL36434.1 rhodanese-like domain-containing protein [Tepidiforma flava]
MATKDPREPFTRISVQEAKEKLDRGEAVMIDVREPHEYVEVHAKGARLIPVNTVINEVKQIREFANGKEVLFICRSGQRSALAAEFATAAGLDDLPSTTSKAAPLPGSKRATPPAIELLRVPLPEGKFVLTIRESHA